LRASLSLITLTVPLGPEQTGKPGLKLSISS
jgi:hypothetical protein